MGFSQAVETAGSTHRDRLETRLIMLTNLADYLDTARITSVQSASTDLNRVTNKSRIAQSFGKLRDIHPLAGELRSRAEAKGLNPARVTTHLFKRIVNDGDDGLRLAADDSPFGVQNSNQQALLSLDLLVIKNLNL